MPARGFVEISSLRLCRVVRFLCLLGVFLPATTNLEAQPAVSAPSSDFQNTVQRAGLIFDGTVTAVQCEFGKTKQPQTYRISFQVKQGIRGAATGSTYIIREWAGLWTAGQKPRYHVGERALLFLYPPSSVGLTSTVGGRNGKLAIIVDAFHEPQVALPPGWLETVGQPSMTTSTSSSAVVPAKVLSPPAPLIPEAWLLQRVAQISAWAAGGR